MVEGVTHDISVTQSEEGPMKVGSKVKRDEVTGPWKPSKWEYFLMGENVCICCSCWTWFGVGWLFFAMFMIKILDVKEAIFDTSSPPVDSSPIVQGWFAVEDARRSIRGSSCDDEDHEDNETVCKKNEECQWDTKRELCENLEICPVEEKKRSGSLVNKDGRSAWVMLIYEALDSGSEPGNIFDDTVLKNMKTFEDELLTNANGASMKEDKSPWHKNWCQLTYSMDPNKSSISNCAPVYSLANAMSVTKESHSTIKKQIEDGFHFMSGMGIGHCIPHICGADDALCSVCTNNGAVLPHDEWPQEFADCIGKSMQVDEQMLTRMQAPQPQGSTTTTTTDVCDADGGGGLPEMSPQMMSMFSSCIGTPAEQVPCVNEILSNMIKETWQQSFDAMGMCMDQPSCQYAPPLVSRWCSSIGYYHPTDNPGRLLSGKDKEKVIEKMCDDSNSGWFTQRKFTLPSSLDCKKKTAKFSMARFGAGGSSDDELTAYDDFATDYVQNGQNGWYRSIVRYKEQIRRDSGQKLRIMVYSGVTLLPEILAILINDMILSIGSLVLVWAYMWFTLESLFLATCAIFEILFSLPVALSLWTVICQQRINTLQPLVVYMILGIGADDAFILYDSWIQSQYEAPEISGHWATRFSWAYRKSFHAMAITTATTCFSFCIGACSPLPAVQQFCIFAAVVVLVDWIFCETFFASAIIVYERVFKKPDSTPGECCGPGCCFGCWRACLKRAKPEWLPKKRLKGDPVEKRGMEKFCEGPLFNFLRRYKLQCVGFWALVCIACTVNAAVQLKTAEEQPPIGRDDLDVVRGFAILRDEFSFGSTPRVYFAWGIDADKPVKKWTVEKKDPEYLGTVGELVSAKGQKELLQFCRAADEGDNDLRYRCSDRNCIILGASQAKACPYDKTAWIKDAVMMSQDEMCQGGRYCFMELFAQYWAQKQGDCRALNEDNCLLKSADCDFTSLDGRDYCYSKKLPGDYPGLPEAIFMKELRGSDFTLYSENVMAVLNRANRRYEASNMMIETGFKMNADNTKLKFAFVSFNSTIPRRNPVEENNAIYDRWDAFKTKHAPNLGGIQTANAYVYMVTQREMVKAALLGICLSVFVAGLVLTLTTWNFYVGLLGLSTICGISLVFLGLMPLLGWQLGENECIFLIAVVGLSVDYTVHLLHSYNQGGETKKRPSEIELSKKSAEDGGLDDRELRARHALAEMGISVMNSAVTTLLAAAILFFCGFYFFIQFGAFIFFVIGLSIVMSITLLIPMLMLLGPHGSDGSLPQTRWHKTYVHELKNPDSD